MIKTYVFHVVGMHCNACVALTESELSEVPGVSHVKASLKNFRVALPVAGAFIVLFIILQKLGIVNLITSSNVGYGTAFVIGLIASVSTCMAVVGGLVLSMSA